VTARAAAISVVLVGFLIAPQASGAAQRLAGSTQRSTAPTITPASSVRAQRTRAVASGTARAVHLHVAAGSRTRRIRVGIYGDAGRRPGRLLAAGRRSLPRRSGWVRIGLSRSATLVAGKRYWVSALPLRGNLRSGSKGGCRTRILRSIRRKRLPARFAGGRRGRRCGLSAYVSGAQPSQPPGGDPGDPPGGGGRGAELASPRQAVVDAAAATPPILYGRRYAGGADASEGWGGGAPVVLAVAAYAGNTSADAALLRQLADLLAGGNEPVADGGYTAQHERWGTGMLAIVRHTPRIWARLSAQQQHRADLVMTGALVASAFTTSDSNPYVASGGQQRTLDGDTDVNRDWNPNYREGMVGGLLVGAGYFGTEGAKDVLERWSHGPFLAQLRAEGLTNMGDTFAWAAEHPADGAPSPGQIEAAIRGWRYHGTGLGDTMGLAWRLAEDTFERPVSCGLNDGAGIPTADGAAGTLVSGCAGLPAKGQLGMLKEFDTLDAGGARSSGLYAYDSFRIHLVNHCVLLATGLWTPGGTAAEIVGRLRVGAPDLFYKLDRGYRGYAKGESQWVPDSPAPAVFRADNPNFAVPFTRSLWEDVVAPFHG
jgi:hypothetical protein